MMTRDLKIQLDMIVEAIIIYFMSLKNVYFQQVLITNIVENQRGYNEEESLDTYYYYYDLLLFWSRCQKQIEIFTTYLGTICVPLAFIIGSREKRKFISGHLFSNSLVMKIMNVSKIEPSTNNVSIFVIVNPSNRRTSNRLQNTRKK